MYIITKTAFEDGSRSALQTWKRSEPPEGCAICPDEFHSVFYSTSPAGFVNITVTDDTVTAMTVNQAAYDAYIAANPGVDEPSEPTESEPTADEILDTLLGV